MKNKKIFIGLVFGGSSREHNVSIHSAKTIFNALKGNENSKHFNVVCIYIDPNGYWWDLSTSESILSNTKVNKKTNNLPLHSNKGFHNFPRGSEEIDIWFPVLHGPNGEDGTIQGLFTLTKKPFVGSGVLGSSVGMDKIAMKAAFHSAGIPQVKYCIANSIELLQKESQTLLIERIEQSFNYPCFVKPANLGSSVGISKARNRSELIQGLHLAAELDARLVIEEGVEAREMECAVLGKKELKASVVGEITYKSDWYDYETKYLDNESKQLIPAPITSNLSEKIRHLTLASCKSIAVEGLARVDFFYVENQEKVFINEINTLPGFTSQSMYPMLWKASGFNLEDLVAELVKSAK